MYVALLYEHSYIHTVYIAIVYLVQEDSSARKIRSISEPAEVKTSYIDDDLVKHRRPQVSHQALNVRHQDFHSHVA